MICPFRHDIECDDCDLQVKDYDKKGGYSACAFIEISDTLKVIAKALESIAQGVMKR